ncbi:MAG: hypothetical protein EOO50_00155 [Flavobacterium sp.]|uniref:hypothetical protein n=1 Tax=Flavobacterium sp. TaxID=239 RepID=UPI00122699C7|nr:hypothetical protein [Flavobacterium sp.]RZJ68627.1 MAG: hypothetical protein EOO50_00155 [Flavobacterium sp.]
MQKLPFGRKETFVLSYYFVGIGLAILLHNILPNPAHAPGIGMALFLLLIPVSIVYGLIHFAKWVYGKHDYRTCLLIHASIWLVVFAYIKIMTWNG